MNSISPELSFLYEYWFEEDMDAIDIHVPFASSFDSDKLKVKYTENKDGLSVTISSSGHVPIIKGHLIHNVKDVKTKREENELIIRLEKASPMIWNDLIDDFYPDTEIIDPQSAYRNSKKLKNSDPSLSNAFLEIAVQYGYLPALRRMYKEIKEDGDESVAVQYLETAARRYADVKSMYLYALYLEKSPTTIEQSYCLFERAASTGHAPSIIECARIKSPISNIPYNKKDPKLAYQLLKGLVDKDENNAEALHELAKLIRNGVGTKKSKKLALQLHAKALLINSNLPALMKYSIPKKVSLVSLSVGVAVTVVLGGLALRYFCKRRNH